MRVILIMLLIMITTTCICFAWPFDNVTDNINEKVDKAIDNQTEKLNDKVMTTLDKVFDWTMKKIKALIWYITEIFSIIGIGWLLSFLCDHDSRIMIKILVVLCVISVTVDKLIN
jgi:hypothetical protein